VKAYKNSLNISVILSGLIFSACVFAQQQMNLCMSGYINYRSGLHDQAISELENCIKSENIGNESLARAYRFLGLAYHAKEAYLKAINSYDQAMRLNPKDPWYDFLNRGNTYLSMNELNKALNDYNNALELNPNFGAAYFYRGFVFEKTGQFQKAESDFVTGYKKGFRSPLINARMLLLRKKLHVETGTDINSENGSD
jgi:tetratricopeptide (TPR) repeat protein